MERAQSTNPSNSEVHVQRYHHFDVYPPYHDIDADLDGYTHEFAPEVPISTAELATLLGSDTDGSLYDRLVSTLFSR